MHGLFLASLKLVAVNCWQGLAHDLDGVIDYFKVSMRENLSKVGVSEKVVAGYHEKSHLFYNLDLISSLFIGITI